MMKLSRVHAACCDPKQIHPQHRKPQTYPPQWAACCPGAEPQTPPPAPAAGTSSLPSATAEEHPEQPGTWQGCRSGLGREWESGGLLLQVLRKVPWQLWVFCRLYRRRRSLPGPVKLTVQIKSVNKRVWVFHACLLISYIISINPHLPQHLAENFAYQRFMSEITPTALNSLHRWPASLFLNWQTSASHLNGVGITWAATACFLLIFKQV